MINQANGHIMKNIDFFLEYMKVYKNSSDNTLQSYKRDLNAMASYFIEQGIDEVSRINGTNINSYVLYLEKSGKSAATITRNISAIKTFFRCMINYGQVTREPTENLQPPQNEQQKSDIVSDEDMKKILEQIKGDSCKELRDRAMLKLLMDTGLKVSEVIGINIEDVNVKYGFVTCHGRKKDKTVKFSDDTGVILGRYLGEGRGSFIKNNNLDENSLFLNCFGRRMTRQGFWKIYKEYVMLSGVQGATTHGMKRLTK